MKKIIALGIAVLVLLVSLTGCDENPVADSGGTQPNIQTPNTDSGVEMIVNSSPITLERTNINEVDVFHVRSGQVTEWTINEEQQIDDLMSWFNNLSLSKKQFADDNSPGDAEGGEVYIFTFDNDVSFSFGYYGPNDYYIIAGDWYKIKNPTRPFND
jgi:hypothetical protein